MLHLYRHENILINSYIGVNRGEIVDLFVTTGGAAGNVAAHRGAWDGFEGMEDWNIIRLLIIVSHHWQLLILIHFTKIK